VRSGRSRSPRRTDLPTFAELTSQSPVEWIVPLAEPYLRGYTPVSERTDSLKGVRFYAPGSCLPNPDGMVQKRRARPSTGFFVGYLVNASGFPFLRATVPECVVFWFIQPPGGSLHHRLVSDKEGLARSVTEYIRWLTHRPPRFELFEAEPMTMVRHDSMQSWPPAKRKHLSRNFFVETLAWLVRSGIVRRLPSELGS